MRPLAPIPLAQGTAARGHVMLQELVMHVPPTVAPAERLAVWEALTTAFPGLSGTVREVALPTPRLPTELLWVRVASTDWRRNDFDPVAVDRQVQAAVAAGWLRMALTIDDAPGTTAIVDAATEIVTRYQRYVDRRNPASATTEFSQLLATHRSLYDLSKPLARADYDHAVDSWRWLLRLEPTASLASQIAVLFHDVARLTNERDARVEQHAPDDVAYRCAHAAHGAALTRKALRTLALPKPAIERAVELVARHEAPDDDPELRLLNDADALSFFSLNACGFMDTHGTARTETKIDCTLSRLSPWALPRLRDVKLRSDFADLLRGRLVKACIDLAGAIDPGDEPVIVGAALH